MKVLATTRHAETRALDDDLKQQIANALNPESLSQGLEENEEVAVVVYPESTADEQQQYLDKFSTYTHGELMRIAASMQRSIESHKQVLRQLYYRDQSEITDQINNAVQDMEDVKPSYLTEYLRQRYPYNFWWAEPDADYKFQLAVALWNKCLELNPNFKNTMLQGIVNRDPSADGLMRSWIEEN